MPLRFEAAILSLTLSPMTSRSNWAKDRKKYVQRQPPHARGGVEGLRHRNERDFMRVELLDQLGEVGERARQAVDLSDDNDVHPALPHLGEKEAAGRDARARRLRARHRHSASA